jgi:hypothetical protein
MNLHRYISNLMQWQDLAGGIIGGLMGVVGAWIVAGSFSLRERRSAARLLTVDVYHAVWVHKRVMREYEKIRTGRAAMGLEETSFRDWLPQLLQIYTYRLSPVFEEQTLLLLYRGGWLAWHLRNFVAIYTEMAEHLALVTTPRTPALNQSLLEGVKRTLETNFEMSYEAARCAGYYLGPEQRTFVPALWFRVRRRWWPTEEQQEAAAILQRKHSKSEKKPIGAST